MVDLDFPSTPLFPWFLCAVGGVKTAPNIEQQQCALSKSYGALTTSAPFAWVTDAAEFCFLLRVVGSELARLNQTATLLSLLVTTKLAILLKRSPSRANPRSIIAGCV